MAQTELLGAHVHHTAIGTRVHIWRRGDVYLARGRFQSRQFGSSLGTDERDAACTLRHLLVQLDNGTFERPSEARQRPLSTKQVPKLTVRELCNRFLSETRRLRGKRTAGNYQSRLTAVIAFAERSDSVRRWPRAADVDREFALHFRSALLERTVTRNGHANAEEHRVSPRHVFNVLESARMLLSWGKRPDINQLPATFVNPFMKDIVGHRPRKDPLRPIPIPLDRRIATVRLMDRWQLVHFAIPLILPLRPEDYAGLVISDVDFDQRLIRFGTRFGGHDFNKGRQSFSVPFPVELLPFLQSSRGERVEGPLLQRRAIWEGRSRPKVALENDQDIQSQIDARIRAAAPGELQADQDAKLIVRRLIRDLGGASGDELAKNYKELLAMVGTPREIRFYDLRASCNTEMDRCRVSHFVQRYVTGHTSSDIMLEYVSLDLHAEMQRYFEFLRPLLAAMHQRAGELKLVMPEGEQAA